ncbi:MAG: 30S ribosomal protein S20 [Myxococcales bacterium]|nr:30S ribosomal protein S20 [Myxococcales bacterium]
MANHKSALKRTRQNTVRRDRNRAIKSRLRATLKEARAAVDASAEGAAELVKTAESQLRRAASKGVIPPQRASRLVSRLSRR